MHCTHYVFIKAIYRNCNSGHTSSPSGKHRQKKSGRGRPTASFVASVITAVTRTENKRPALKEAISNYQAKHNMNILTRQTNIGI